MNYEKLIPHLTNKLINQSKVNEIQKWKVLFFWMIAVKKLKKWIF